MKYRVLLGRDFKTWAREMYKWGELCMFSHPVATLHSLVQKDIDIDNIVFSMIRNAEQRDSAGAMFPFFELTWHEEGTHEAIDESEAKGIITTLTYLTEQHKLARVNAIRLRNKADHIFRCAPNMMSAIAVSGPHFDRAAAALQRSNTYKDRFGLGYVN